MSSPKSKVGNAGVMIVTGGGRGIGAAVARLASERGYSVAINFAQNAASASKLVTSIQDAGGNAISIKGDVSREDDVMRMFEEVDLKLGPVGVLVNNAGVTGGFSRLENVSAEMLSKLFAINVVGAFLCSREAVRRMSTRNGGTGGSIVNVSSRSSQYGGAGEWIHYASSKGAMDTLTLGMSRELASEGIRANAIAPGFIETDLHAEAGAPDRAIRLAAGTPIGRPGTAHEIAEVALWLASPAASYVTGAIVAAAGGR
ncbi:SDR family oxidoreductase [Bradyrhizobium sp. LA6.7]|uniref:SDR family oxidoreductase n=1 Tax=unclassified Bradyrhizobium TaxID=2631580 RepID=UPI0033979E8D